MFVQGKEPVEGFTSFVGPDTSDLKLLSLGRLYFSQRQSSYSGETGDNEVVFDILTGTCDITVSDGVSKRIEYKNIGRRRSPFEASPTMLYLPKDREYIVTPRSDLLDIVVCTAPSTLNTKSVLVKPEDVLVTSTGRANWRRDVRLVIGSNVNAQRLIVGETLNPPGNWSGYPPHKHDVHNFPQELPAEEVYLFLTELPQGFGLSRVYTGDQTKDHPESVYTVRNNDIITIPRGYHTFVAGAGYRICYLFALAGEKRVYGLASTDPEHSWLKNCDPILEELGKF